MRSYFRGRSKVSGIGVYGGGWWGKVSDEREYGTLLMLPHLFMDTLPKIHNQQPQKIKTPKLRKKRKNQDPLDPLPVIITLFIIILVSWCLSKGVWK